MVDIRPYQPGDERPILDLFRQSYGRGLGEQVWAWRFRDHPAGAGVIDVAWDGDVLAAHYAVSPAIVRMDGHDRRTGVSGTTMTHPAYRGRGLFPELARSTYARMTELGMAMVFGFPNRLSHRGFIRDLGWIDISEVPTFRLSLPGRLSLPAACDNVVELDGFDDRFDRLWNRLKDDFRMVSRRDCRYLQWRYRRNPTGQYRILAYLDAQELSGYAVLKRYKEEWHVVDILALPDTDVGEQLIYRAAEIALEGSALALSLWLNVTHPLHWALERLGFQNEGPVTYFGGLILRPDLVGTIAYEYRNWYLTMGDSDVY
jgi:hypothetical protein